ncbi:hypothetical protein SKAU_G00004670 [Synaphobranchus kaupii]|uniref:AT-hook transcription factor n=1 Tax=Synaphobranchus kaupii TaxID=118154 RepID=A0A9Q1GA19_SYNKA|nr:hypothetical protein SKAU_G00004670 [Synaphobranchus kaupii]
MDENGIIGLNQAAAEEGGGAKAGEGDAVSHLDPLQDQSFHLSNLQAPQSPGGDGHALSLCDLDEQGSDSRVSEEDKGSWLFGLPETDRQGDMTEGEEEGETNDQQEFSGSFNWGAVDPRDELHRTEAPEPGQAEERDVSRVGRCHGNQREVGVAALRINRDSPGESHGCAPLENALPAQSSYPPLSPSPPSGGPQHSLGGFNSTPVHPHQTNNPEFESDAFTESQSASETQLEPPRAFSPGSERQESLDRSVFTPSSCSLQPRRVLARGTGRTEEEQAEDEEEDRRTEGPGCSHPTPPLPRTPKLMLHNSQAPPSSALQCTRKVWQCPSEHAPYLRIPKGLRTSTGASPKRGCSQDSSRYGKGQLNHPLPDFSKVEPRVRFPKGGYKPPKSKGCPRKKSLASEKPLVFKSPADIVREVLMSSTDAPLLSPRPLTPAGPPRPLNATVPQEFRSPQQASSLVHQLQEDYNRLLTKYAEAENTIDRLRLEAKVNLYSDPPKPSYPDYIGTLNMGSKVVTMTFPRAQRAEMDSIAASPGTNPAEKTVAMGDSTTVPSTSAYTSTCSLGPRFGERLTVALSSQAERFQMQVDAFEELLRRGKLKPLEQALEGLSCLAQGQGSLERGYLRAREEHRLQQQQGRDPGLFDPHRELEGEIFRSGMRLEVLKEQVQMGEQVRPVSTSPPLTPLGTDLTMGPSTASAPYPYPETQTSPTGRWARVSMGVAVSSAGEENEGQDEGETDERGPSHLPWAGRQKQQHGENDLSHLPQQVPQVTREGVLGPSPGCGQQEPVRLLPTFPWQQSPATRSGGAKSRGGSPASAGESGAFEGRASKPQTSLGRAPPQDGIMSAETDSGFVGSESSRLRVTPSPAQQEAVASQSSSLEGGGAEMLPVSTQPCLGITCQGLTTPDRSRTVTSDPEVLPSEKSRLAPPTSPRHWPSSSASKFESESDRSHSSSEAEEESQSVRYTQPANRQPRHQRIPSLTDLHCHGEPFGIQGAGQPADRHKAIQSLQAEVSRLSEQLEGSLRRGESSHPVTAPPLVQESPLHSQNSCTLYPRVSQDQEDEMTEEEGEQEEEVETEEEEEEAVEEEEEEEVEGTAEAPYKRPSPDARLRPELDTATDSQHSQTTSKPQSCRHGPTRDASTARLRLGGADAINQSQRRSHAHSNHTPNDINVNPTRVGTAGGVATTHQTCLHSGPRPHFQGSSLFQGRTDSAGVSMHRTSGSAHSNVWPVGFTHRKDGGVFLTAPPPPVLSSVPLVQYVPICQPVLYCSTPTSEAPPTYPQPLHLLLDRGGRGARSHAHTPPADHESLSGSLTHAIETARRMRAASRRMARSLSAGIRHRGALSLS